MAVYRSALDNSDKHSAFNQAFRPTIVFVAANDGAWPRSWDDLASVEPATNFEWVAQHIDYNFNADPAELARSSPSTFDAIKTKRSSQKFEYEIRLLIGLLRQHHPQPYFEEER